MMEITRHFNGLSLTITLTNSELREAFEYQQRMYDEFDIASNLQDVLNEGSEYPDDFIADMMELTDFIDDATNYYRDNYTSDVAEYDQRDEAVMMTLRKYYPDWKKNNKEESNC